MFVMETKFFHIFSEQTAVCSPELDVVVDLWLSQRSLLTKVNQIFFLLKPMTCDSWGPVGVRETSAQKATAVPRPCYLRQCFPALTQISHPGGF